MRFILLFVFVMLGVGCNQQSSAGNEGLENQDSLPPAYISIDSSNEKEFRTVIIEEDSIVEFSENDLRLVDSMLQKKVEEHNNRLVNEEFIDLSKYGRQYFPFLNSAGQKEVEVNLFCVVHKSDDWRWRRIHVKDGGSCYFNIIVNLKTAEIVSFYINGEA